MASNTVEAPLTGVVVQVMAEVGQAVVAGEVLVVLEAMKMEHEVCAPSAGVVRHCTVSAGDMVQAHDLLMSVDAATDAAADPGLIADSVPEQAPAEASPAVAHDRMRADLLKVTRRHHLVTDEARPEAVAKRHDKGFRTARENIAATADAHSFVEYGAMAYAAQTRRRSLEDLQTNTPADGLIAGTAQVNAQAVGCARSTCLLMAYDMTVLAGTQGFRNHQKMDRVLHLAHRNRWPVVLWAEGGGGRPGDVDMPIVAGLHVPTFAAFAGMSGVAPVVGVVHGRCFAGNAALLGCCDVVIATRGANVGMGGPAMIEGAGLGEVLPEAIGPADVQHANGVIDVLVDDEVQAAQAARRYLSYFQGDWPRCTPPDVSRLRDAVPENRLRVYDTRTVMDALFDQGSVLHLRTGFGVGIHTALARLDGRAVGVMANNPAHLGGAIDPDAADKAARFMRLCDVHGLPIVSLIDTPGFMVGPGIEAQAQVRHTARLFVVSAHLRVPVLGVVLRKGYGLGAMGVAGGGFHAAQALCAWPTGEFGGMGLEGAVRLGYKKELMAVPEGAQREALFERLLAEYRERGEALNMAATLEIDAVIDPAHTRVWLGQHLSRMRVLDVSPPYVDSW
jgi:acetyl-CoA carboxylase carboxyltransferase component